MSRQPPALVGKGELLTKAADLAVAFLPTLVVCLFRTALVLCYLAFRRSRRRFKRRCEVDCGWRRVRRDRRFNRGRHCGPGRARIEGGCDLEKADALSVVQRRPLSWPERDAEAREQRRAIRRRSQQ